MDNAEKIRREGQKAQEAYIRSHLVAVDQLDADGGRYIGSATCIEINNRIFLFTAAHNFKGIPRGGKVIFSSTHPPAGIPLTAIRQNYSEYGKEGTLDVAWVEIDPESAERAGLTGISLDVIDPYHIMDVEKGHFLMVGLPVDFYKLTRACRIMQLEESDSSSRASCDPYLSFYDSVFGLFLSRSSHLLFFS